MSLTLCTEYQTECDKNYEKKCRSARLRYLLQLQLYDNETKSFFKKQGEHAEALWRISVKFNILRDACPRGIYPQTITDQVMCEMLIAKEKLFQKMRCDLHEWLSGETMQKLRANYVAFQCATRPIKWSYPSRLIRGSTKEKPLKFYIDSALDVMYYFECLQKHVEGTFRAITLFNSDSMSDHTKTLKYSTKFMTLLGDLLLYGKVLMVQDAVGNSVEDVEDDSGTVM